MEAVKQGSAAVGIKSKTHAILVALKVLLFSNLLIKTYCLPITTLLFHN
jgi:20S proteasome alpha/beta subunit